MIATAPRKEIVYIYNHRDCFCQFSDKNGNPIDGLEMREMFLQGEEPTINGYNFNGSTEWSDEYMSVF